MKIKIEHRTIPIPIQYTVSYLLYKILVIVIYHQLQNVKDVSLLAWQPHGDNKVLKLLPAFSMLFLFVIIHIERASFTVEKGGLAED